MKQENTNTFLKKIELFKNLADTELAKITSLLKPVSLPAGSIIFRENMPRKSVYIVSEGKIELFKNDPYGKETVLSVFGKYDFLGEGALLEDYPHSTSARATCRTSLFEMTRDSFKQLLAPEPELSALILSNVAHVIARRMRQASTRVVDISAQYVSGRTRSEHDLLGEREVPYEFYYGVQTLRGMENFNISGVTISHFTELIDALAVVKMAAAKANNELGMLSDSVSEAIVQACQEIVNHQYHNQFVIDMIQGGAGTSTNMNANEVIANRALEILGYEKGQYEYCHPNNHVNLSQSTNDAYPTALKIAAINSNTDLISVLKELIDSFRLKSDAFSDILKMGRTQLQDAVPMTLGQEFGAYASTLEEEVQRLEENARLFLEVNMGATAIGTGINTNPAYAGKVVEHLRSISGLALTLAPNLVEATQDTGSFVMYASTLKRLAIKLSKISNDLRLLSSGPRAGLNEINLPRMQPGSSIMPGKVNPVIPEVVNQIAFKVIGNDLTVSMAAEAGQLELNVMEPVIAQSIFESVRMLKNGMITLKERCVDGITANKEHLRDMVLNSIGIVTALNPVLGYDICTRLAKDALDSGRGVYELVLEQDLLSKKELDKLLAPENMIHPQILSNE